MLYQPMRVFLSFIFIVLASTAIYADVPNTIVYQGRLLDFSTQKPIVGLFTRSFKVMIRDANSQSPKDPLMERTITNVPINDGLFTLTIDLTPGTNETALKFDRPYFVEVAMGDQSRGGRIGQQAFIASPYSFLSRNADSLNSLLATAYASGSHVHLTPNTSAFSVNGSNEPKASVKQLRVVNNRGEVFSVNEDGQLSVNAIRATSGILSRERLAVTKLENGIEKQIFFVNNLGDMQLDQSFGRSFSVQGTVRVTGRLTPFSVQKGLANSTEVATFNTITVNTSLSLGRTSSLTFQGANNIIGSSHTLEDHLSGDETSVMKSKLETLVGGNVVDASFHRHVFVGGEIGDFPTGGIEARHIKDGSISGTNFQSNDPANLIADTKLATISTAGKIALSAVPVEVALTSASNDFSLGIFPQSLNDFDGFKSKTMTIKSTVDNRIAGAFPLFLARDRNLGQINLFQLEILSSGDLVYSRPASPTSSFGFQSPGDRKTTFFVANNVRFEDLLGNTSTNFFNGSLIEDGSILNDDIADNALDTARFTDYSVTVLNSGLAAAAFTTSVETAKLAGSLTSGVIADNSISTAKIKGTSAASALGDISAIDFADQGIQLADFRDETIVSANLASKTVTAGKISNGAVGNTELCYFNNISDRSCLQSEVLTSGKILDGVISNIKITTSPTSLIQPTKLADEVLKARTGPMVISTAASIIVTLQTQVNPDPTTFLKMTLPSFLPGNVYSAGVEILTTNGKRILSLNNNGTISMINKESTTAFTNVTISPKFAATFRMVADSSSNCGNGDSNMVTLSDLGGSKPHRSNCISKNKNHGAVALNYLSAQALCDSNGYKLCSMNSLVFACSKGLIPSGDTTISEGYVRATSGVYLTVSNANKCAASTDFTITPYTLTDSRDFRCCVY